MSSVFNNNKNYHHLTEEAAMTTTDSAGSPTRLQGKNGAMVVCFVLGLGSLVAWNSMLTISDYYYNLFPKYHPARVLTLVYQPFALGTMATLAHTEAKSDTRQRNLTGYILFFLSTLALLVLDLATSGKGGIGNYIGICVIVAAFGVADAHVEGGMVGDLSLMCPEFMQSFLAGLAASGALTSALRLITKAAFEKSSHGLRKGVMLFLAISTFFEFLCIFLYAYIFPKLPIVKYYRTKAASEGSKTVAADLAAAGIQTEGEDDVKQHQILSKKQLLFQNMDYALDLYLIYVLTLSIFPGFLYENTGTHHKLGSWYILYSILYMFQLPIVQTNDDIEMPLFHYLILTTLQLLLKNLRQLSALVVLFWYALVLIAMYNVWDLISRYIPVIECLKIKSRKGLTLAVLSRFLLIPAFYFTAKYGSQGWMIVLVSFLGLTNGYLTVCVMTEAPKGYKGPEQNALGNLMVLFLLGGIFSGVALDWLWLIGSDQKF